MMTNGNSKLGKGIWQFSIPAGLKHICVCLTELCFKKCYARKGNFRRPAVRESLAQNFRETKKENFARQANEFIGTKKVSICRIHASGEFYSPEYVNKWVAIARSNPQVQFFAYTRSWKNKEILKALKSLSKLDNVKIWFSCDRETGAPPKIKNIRRAYLMVSDEDIPSYKVDLVFRDKTETVLKWVGDTIVCPAENGVTKVTCAKCQLCFRDKELPNANSNKARLVQLS